jgi:hypothetical protein
MAETIGRGYRRLFEIRLLHHYWLDEGATIFDLITESETRERRLLDYDMRSFLRLTPTASTSAAIAGFAGVYKATSLGGIVAVVADTVIPADTVFEFLVTVGDPDFFNYTALTLRPQTIHEFYDTQADRLYRYKENVPVLSNLSGASRGSAETRTLFLSAEIPTLAASDPVEALVISSGSLQQLSSDQPDADTWQVAATATDLPVFVHQGDVPVIVPPAELAGVPARGIELTPEVGDDVFALIRLTAQHPDDQDFSFIDTDGQAQATAPVYQARFKSRATFWQYFDKNTGTASDEEPVGPLPLTYFGNAGTGRKPSSGLVTAQTSGSRITRLISEIFV